MNGGSADGALGGVVAPEASQAYDAARSTISSAQRQRRQIRDLIGRPTPIGWRRGRGGQRGRVGGGGGGVRQARRGGGGRRRRAARRLPPPPPAASDNNSSE